MEAYTGFAYVYEKFMDNIPYDQWADYITELLKEQGVESGLLCELGCGTGSMTRRLKEKGFDMIGVDMSPEMLEIAMYEHMEEAQGILFLNQDMREFELYGTVDAIVSVCDSMNYLTDEKDILKVLKLCNNYLEAGGVFIFDMKTDYTFSHEMGNRVIVDNREDATLIWENHYDAGKKQNEYDITIFNRLPAEDEDDVEEFFERVQETHLQKAYDIDTMRRLIEEAGMEFVAVYDAMTHDAPKDDSQRVYFIAREKKQDGKYYGK